MYYEPYFKANSTDEKVAGDYLLLCLALWDLSTAQQHYMKAFKQTEKGLDYLGKSVLTFSFGQCPVSEP